MIDELKFSEIVKLNRTLANSLDKKEYNIAILSNIMVHQLKDVLEYELRINNVNANVKLGDYDNIVQDSNKLHNLDLAVIFWEAINIVDGLEYKASLLKETDFNNLVEKIKLEIDLVLSNLKSTSLIIVNKFSAAVFTHLLIEDNNLDKLVEIINIHLYSKSIANLKILDINKILFKLSVNKSVDFRYYKSSKTLYSIDFYKEYVKMIKPIVLSSTGNIKKALIFDCDNTLWKGIIGEDGIDGIEIYHEIQFIAIELAKKGVILGLCSKNNLSDVNEVLSKHEDMILNDSDIVIKKINWENKATNLINIAKELNIGIDSIVFVDDSSFEINLIKEKIPQILTVQVPVKRDEYLTTMLELVNMFYVMSATKEDSKKNAMYKEEILRTNSQDSFEKIDDYLNSLDLEIELHLECNHIIPRLSQMTQKTNQFNLTTKRYTENDIHRFINDEKCIVMAIGVNDKFGESGITGLCIIRINDNIANIDTMLMSCRIIGRKIEYKYMDLIINELNERDIEILNSKYIKTVKNEQVEDLYDKFGFSAIQTDDKSIKKYNLNIKEYKMNNINYIGVVNGSNS